MDEKNKGIRMRHPNKKTIKLKWKDLPWISTASLGKYRIADITQGVDGYLKLTYHGFTSKETRTTWHSDIPNAKDVVQKRFNRLVDAIDNALVETED